MQPPDLYLVHLWQPEGGFRATARRVDEDQPHLFHSAEDLVSFFGQRSDVSGQLMPEESPSKPVGPGAAS